MCSRLASLLALLPGRLQACSAWSLCSSLSLYLKCRSSLLCWITPSSSLRLLKSRLLNDTSGGHSFLMLQPLPLCISPYSTSSLPRLLFLLSKAFSPPNILKDANLLFIVYHSSGKRKLQNGRNVH